MSTSTTDHPRTDNCPVAHWARKRPELPAVVAASGNVSYGELDHLADGWMQYLDASGFRRNMTISLVEEPSLAYLAALLGAWRAGISTQPLNPKTPRKTLTEFWDQSFSVCAFYSGKIRIEWLGLYRLQSLNCAQDTVASRHLSAETALPEEPIVYAPRTGVLIATSGSTGKPKSAFLRLQALLENAARANRNIPVVPGDRWLLSLPLFHVSGLGALLRSWLGGGAVALPDVGQSPADAIRTLGVTHVSLVATQFGRMMAHTAQREQFAATKAILLGGSAIPEGLIRSAIDLRLPIHKSYGLTEMGSQVCTTPPNASAEDLFTSGYPLAPETVRVSPAGQIEVAGATLFDGYLEPEPEPVPPTIADVLDDATMAEFSRSMDEFNTAQWEQFGAFVERTVAHGEEQAGLGCRLPLTPDGWFPTGDLGRFDEKGRLIVIGRKDNMFISGGENIHPEEVERALLALPGVEQAMVVSVPDAEFVAVGFAFVEARDQMPVDAQSLRDALRAALPGFKIPKYVHLWPADLSPTGIKPSRRAFEQRAHEILKR